MRKIDINDLKECGKFAVILKCLLAKNNMTQGQLAKATGMSEATITHYVKGKYTPSQKNLSKIARCLGVSPQSFFDSIEEYTQYINSTETRFAIRLTSLLKEKNITQEQLAKAIGVSRQTVSYYVNGKQLPMTDIMVKIAKYFDTSVESFIEEKPIDIELPYQTKILVNKMPQNKYSCKFAKFGVSYSENGCEECYQCKFGGVCNLHNNECSYLTELINEVKQ